MTRPLSLCDEAMVDPQWLRDIGFTGKFWNTCGWRCSLQTPCGEVCASWNDHRMPGMQFRIQWPILVAECRTTEDVRYHLRRCGWEDKEFDGEQLC